MFYCEDCRVKNEWPGSIAVSTGRCELCGKFSNCHDKSSSLLPIKQEEKPEEKEETDIYQLLANKLGLKETNIPNKWTNIYREAFYLSKYGFRRMIPGKPFFTNEEVLEMLEVFSAEKEAGGTLAKDIPKWFENEIRRRKA